MEPWRDEYVHVMPAAELAPGQLHELQAGEHRVVVGRLLSGEPVAFQALCPHEAASLVEGHFHGPAIDCPRHHYLFDVHSGDNLFPLPLYPMWKRAQVGDLRLGRFPATEREGWIVIARNPYSEPFDRPPER
ncbi:MAG: Rieske 2Fe-2S domain-containing protein [Chloroflexi bacterium]|nr:Rieske 2Fe-2S domain-containing protein [Chloroflexota bacterium]